MSDSKRLTGPQLQSIRQTLGFRVDRLAQELGVRPDTVSKWERGKDPIPYGLRTELIQVAQTQIPVLEALVADLEQMNQ